MCGTATADVQSANTVGYNTISVTANKWYMLAPQFDAIDDASSDTIDLLKVMSVSGLTIQTWANRALASQISVYDPVTEGYTTYYYASNAGTSGWRKNPSAPSTLPVKRGSGIWLKVAAAEDNSSVTISGQVNPAESLTIDIGKEGEWSVVANPYPVPLTHGSLTTEGITVQTWANRASASQISVYDPVTEGYTTFYYTSNAGSTAWRKNPSKPADTDVIAGIGECFWVKSPTEGSLKFSLNK